MCCSDSYPRLVSMSRDKRYVEVRLAKALSVSEQLQPAIVPTNDGYVSQDAMTIQRYHGLGFRRIRA